MQFWSDSMWLTGIELTEVLFQLPSFLCAGVNIMQQKAQFCFPLLAIPPLCQKSDILICHFSEACRKPTPQVFSDKQYKSSYTVSFLLTFIHFTVMA